MHLKLNNKTALVTASIGGIELAIATRLADNRPTSLIQRLIQPGEIANLLVFVASPLASVINGASLRVDGGLIPTIA